MSTAIVWFRQDLRLADNPALRAAVERGRPVLPLYIWSPEDEGAWPPGAASRWWLHHALTALDRDLRRLGSRLIVRTGRTVETLAALARDIKAAAIYWNRRYEPAAMRIEADVETFAGRTGLAVGSFHGDLLFDPRETCSRQGTPFQVFTPYWKHCLAQPEPARPRPAPTHLPPPARWPASLKPADLHLLPHANWANGIAAAWTPGERAASELLASFIRKALPEYATGRDRLDRDGTSRLSPYLHWGHLSPRQVWHALKRAAHRRPPRFAAQVEAYLRQLGWREFAHHLLVNFPDTPEEPLRPAFGDFPWVDDARDLVAWQQGRTGYPLVDAGLRQLWSTGWMPNRARMVVASFLVKHLLIPWQEGARWFWDTLVDADLANNTFGWQWSAGCGADAAPYFRVFNPALQSRKFDPLAGYVRKSVPELAELPDKLVHEPATARAADLIGTDFRLGATYPEPIVSHAAARRRALAAYQRLRSHARRRL